MNTPMEPPTEAWRKLSAADALKILPAIGRVRLDEVRMMKGLFEIMPLEGIPPDAMGNIKTIQHHVFRPEEPHKVHVTTVYGLVTPLTSEVPQSIPPACNLEMSIGVAYNFAEATVKDQDSIIVWSKVHAVIHTWSFWREFSHSSYARLGVSTSNVAPLIMPATAAQLAGFQDVATANQPLPPAQSPAIDPKPAKRKRK